MKKLKRWQFILLITFYPIGVIYFCVWLFRKSKLKKESAVNKPIKCEIVTKAQAENINCTDNKFQEVSVSLEDLLSNVEKAQNQMDKHFAYLKLQQYYYKIRKESQNNMQLCIDWCLKDISELDKLDFEYAFENETAKRKSIERIGLKAYIEQEEYMKKKYGNNGNDGKMFDGIIPAFEYLAIIYEQAKDCDKAIHITEQAEQYYISHFDYSGKKALPDVQHRLERLKQKIAKEK